MPSEDFARGSGYNNNSNIGMNSGLDDLENDAGKKSKDHHTIVNDMMSVGTNDHPNSREDKPKHW